MKKIVFLLISVILCLCMTVSIIAAEKVGFISNDSGNDSNDGLTDATPKALQGKSNGNGIRNLLYGGGTLVVVGNFNISSNETWDYGGHVTVTGSYDGKDYKNFGGNKGVFKLAADKTLTLGSDLTFDDVIILPGEPRCTIKVPAGKTLRITDSVQIMSESLIVEVAKGGKAIIEGGKYLSIEGEGDITIGENVQVAADPDSVVAFISGTKGNDKYDGLSDRFPQKSLGSAYKKGVYNTIKSGGTLVVCGDLVMPDNYVWSFGRLVTVTGSYNGKDYRNLEENKGVVKISDMQTLTVAGDMTLDNLYLCPGETKSVIFVKKGATLKITENVDVIGETLSLWVEAGGTAIIDSGTYFAIQGAGEIICGDKVKDLGGSLPAYISNDRGNDENDGLSGATAKQHQGSADGNGIRSMLEGGGTLVVCGDYSISSNETWKYGGPLTITAMYDEKNYGGVFKLSDGKGITITHDVTFDNIQFEPGETGSVLRVASGATLTITDSVNILRDTLIIQVESGGTAVLEGGTYKAILGKGEIKVGEKVKNLGATVPGFISNASGNDNNSGLLDGAPKQNQGKTGGSGVRELLYGGGTLVVVGNFNISSNETWDYGGPMTVTGSYNGKDYRNVGANTGIFKLKDLKTLTIGTDLTLDNLLVQPGETSGILRVKNGVTLHITDSVEILAPTLSINVETGGTAIIDGGVYKSIQGGGNITLGKDVKIVGKPVGYISNANGKDSNDGLSDATPKALQGKPDGSGVRNLLYGGGTLVVVGNFNISSNENWDYGGPMVVTGSYDGKNYKDYDLNTGIFKLSSDKTLTVSNSLTFDDILFLPGDKGSVILVPDGAKLHITESVEFMADTLSIVVEKGGSAVIESGTFVSISGEGDIKLGEDVKICPTPSVGENSEPVTAYISFATGKNRNDGLSADSAKQYIGTVTGNGIRNLLNNGGTLVVSGDCGIKADLNWNFSGAVTVTAKTNDADYRDKAKNTGILELWPNAILTVSNDLTLKDLILTSSDTYNVIRVQNGATLIIDETVDVCGTNIAIDVEKGAKAVIESGTYMAIRGAGDITVSDTVRIEKKYGLINPTVKAKGSTLGNAGFISNDNGNDSNDGRSPETPKALQGKVDGKGIRNLMYGGGTLVVVGNFNISSNENWDYGGKIVLTGSYDGKDYRNMSANTGIFKLKGEKTLSVISDLSMDKLIVQIGKSNVFHVKNNAVFSVSNTVSFIDSDTGGDGICRLIVDKGSLAIIDESVKHFFIIEGEGEVVVYDSSAFAGTDDVGDTSEDSVVNPLPEEPVSDGSVYLSNSTGDNENDGLSPQTPKKNFGSPLGDGAYNLLRDGGCLVLCGDLVVSGDYIWAYNGEVTVTANHRGKDYKNPFPTDNPTAGCLKITSGATFTVNSDLVLDDMIFFQADDQNTIVVNNATFTVTDTVQFMCGSGQNNRCKLVLNEGAVAYLSDEAQKVFEIQGDGTVVAYTPVVEEKQN